MDRMDDVHQAAVEAEMHRQEVQKKIEDAVVSCMNEKLGYIDKDGNFRFYPRTCEGYKEKIARQARTMRSKPRD